MKKNQMKKIALMGLTMGIVASSQLSAADAVKDKVETASESASIVDPNEGNIGYHLMTEDELLLELNGDGAALYNSLDSEGKALAREVASQRCNGTNACKGLNACATDKNTCAGKGECKGKGKCAIADKNLAVKLVTEKIKMADKREKTLNN